MKDKHHGKSPHVKILSFKVFIIRGESMNAMPIPTVAFCNSSRQRRRRRLRPISSFLCVADASIAPGAAAVTKYFRQEQSIDALARYVVPFLTIGRCDFTGVKTTAFEGFGHAVVYLSCGAGVVEAGF